MGADELSSNPLLCVVHDDRGVRELLVGDLAARFGAQYEIEAHATADSAISALRRRARDGAAVAAVFNTETDSCGGETFRAAVHDLHPLARRVVLVGRGEWSKVHPAVAAMRSGQAEAYVFVPWTLRERWLYLPVTELLADWEASQPPPVEAAKVIGEEWDARAHALRELLGRIGVPFGFHPPASSEARHALGADDLTGGAFPVIAFRTGTVLVDPPYERLATELGFATDPEMGECDLVIVGAGPAGLAAAVYGGSEGLSTVLVEEALPGGQAGTSSRIRNYLGFPTGISGRDLLNRALEQAWFFGARIVLSKRTTAITPNGSGYALTLSGQSEITARSVILATGVRWRRLGIPSLQALEGAGVFYGSVADSMTAERGQVYVVGAGNSAGQAAVHLSRSAVSVTLLVRSDDLAATMSDYLVRELEETVNIRIRLETEVIDGGGPGHLTTLALRDRSRGVTEEVSADALYVMIGTEPDTDWLTDALARDERGFVLVGPDAIAAGPHRWPLKRPPMLLETSLPGVFAAGDVRHGSVKRVASAVGTGSVAVQLAHRYLAEARDPSVSRTAA